MKCRELMVGDWIVNENKFPMQITNVGDDYVYATWEGNDGDPWEFDDKDCQPSPIEITEELLEANGWYIDPILKCYSDTPSWLYEEGGKEELLLRFSTKESTGALGIFDGQKIRTMTDFLWKGTLYVHELQHAMRLCGFNGLADKFKV